MSKCKKKRYAIVGVSHRAFTMFMDPIRQTYSQHAELVAMLDKDKLRMENYKEERMFNAPCYSPEEFDKMVKETCPNVIIVACQDGMHHEYIIKALEYNLDVIVEKPLTISEEYCRDIAEALEKSSGNVTVTFNYRYAPQITKIKELVADGKIGKVVSIDLNWYLDTYHGASYFQRWNRLREVSGGLSVHKSCHHFDLVQWWIDQKPVEVFAYGALNFYGPDGVNNPLAKNEIGDGRTCPECEKRDRCKHYMRWNRSEHRGDRTGPIYDQHYSGSRQYSNYSHRQCIYDPQINIEDTYAAVIKYDGGAMLSYTLNGCMPYEGFRLGINGTKGRIEYMELHAPKRLPFPIEKESNLITLIPLFGGRERIDVINLGGGHSGGDPLMRDELFIGTDTQCPVQRQASVWEGIDVVLTGVAVYRSVLEHRIIIMDDLRSKVFANIAKSQKLLSRASI